MGGVLPPSFLVVVVFSVSSQWPDLFFGAGRLKVAAGRTDYQNRTGCNSNHGCTITIWSHTHHGTIGPGNAQAIVTIWYSRCDSDKSVLPAANLSLPAPKNKSVLSLVNYYPLVISSVGFVETNWLTFQCMTRPGIQYLCNMHLKSKFHSKKS